MTHSLWTTALVGYARCYASGTRYNLRVDDLQEEYPEGNLAELHEYFKNLRDKHAAHSVSPLETFGTGVLLVEEEGGSLRTTGLQSRTCHTATQRSRRPSRTSKTSWGTCVRPQAEG
jgi:hypothetical protein